MTPDHAEIARLVEWAEASHIAGDGEWNQYDYATVHECGTAYCIAGKWALDHGWTHETDRRGVEAWRDPEGVLQDPGIGAWDALGLTYDQVWGALEGRERGLFQQDNSIDDLRRIAKDLRTEAGL